MTTEQQKKLLENLQKEKEEILSELSDFTQKDPNVEGGFSVPFPNEGSGVDENAREIQEFERSNILKDNLSKRIRSIKKAIRKIEEGKYGQCENCSSSIGDFRLKAIPTAKFCIDCANKVVSRKT